MRIYADGVFDLFHFGHGCVFEQIKTLYPDCYLIIGLHSDEVVHDKKGVTVMTYEERAKSISYNKYVDEIYHNAPWIITEEFININNIDYVAHDDTPYISKDDNGNILEDIYSIPKRLHKFLSIKYTSGISTTELISRIIKNYDVYKTRNEKRGVI